MKVSLQIWGLGAGIGAAAVIAGGLFLGVQPALAQSAQTDQQTAGIASRNQAAEVTLEQLSKQNAKVGTLQAEQQVLLKAVPTILKPNTFLRRVEEVAAIDNVVVQAVTPGDATAYTPPPSAVSQGAAGSSAGASGAAAATAAGTTGPVLAATDPLITATNFTVVPVTVQVSGTESAVLQFAHDIANDERVFLINGVSTAADSGQVSASYTGYIYTLKR